MTKKYFEAVAANGRQTNHFIAPLRKADELSFVSMKTGKVVSRFVVVYTGVDLTPDIVFAKMIDAGLRIESVEQTLKDIESLLAKSKAAKLGHVYEATIPGQPFELTCLGKHRSS